MTANRTGREREREQQEEQKKRNVEVIDITTFISWLLLEQRQHPLRLQFRVELSKL
jgi:hypothetical protein